MARTGVWRRRGLLLGSLIALTPAFSQPLPAAAAGGGTLFGIAIQTATVVSIDPSSGATKTLANLSLPPGQPGPGFSVSMVDDPSTHRLFLVRVVFDPTSFPPTTTDQLITVDTRTGASTVSPALSHPVTSLAIDTSTGTLFGMTGDCCPNQIVSIDPATGSLTHVADVIGDSFSFLAMAPSTHSLYVESESFATIPPTNALLTVNAATGIVTSTPVATGIRSMVFDTSLGSLFGVTFFPPHFIRIDPATGVETPLGSYDFGFFMEPGTAIDSASHTVFFVEDVIDNQMIGPIAHIASLNDQTGAGVLGGTTGVNLAAIAFEPVAITDASIQASVRDAFAKGLIKGAGLEHSLLTRLEAAADARAKDKCEVAADRYGVFVRHVNRRSGDGIDPATATQLVSEAQYLIAHCP